MRNFLLTLATTATLLVSGLVWTDTAEARPRWRAGYYRGPAWGYYEPGYYYGPSYYSGYYYGPPRYYSYPDRYSWGEVYAPGVYFRF
jgi:hypothetical protein